MRKEKYYAILILLFIIKSVSAQFVHPGLSHKISDLDRIKAQVEAQINPWYTSYQDMVADSKSSYNYSVRGKESFTELGRDNGVNYKKLQFKKIAFSQFMEVVQIFRQAKIIANLYIRD